MTSDPVFLCLVSGFIGILGLCLKALLVELILAIVDKIPDRLEDRNETKHV